MLRHSAVALREVSSNSAWPSSSITTICAYRESLDNLTLADVYFGRAQTILTRRESTKLKTIKLRRRLHHLSAATTSTQMDQTLS